MREELESRQQALVMQFDTREEFKTALRRLVDIELSIEAVRCKITLGA
jgi:hypothetical protein